jgi:hypothetical protein
LERKSWAEWFGIDEEAMGAITGIAFVVVGIIFVCLSIGAGCNTSSYLDHRHTQEMAKMGYIQRYRNSSTGWRYDWVKEEQIPKEGEGDGLLSEKTNR